MTSIRDRELVAYTQWMSREEYERLFFVVEPVPLYNPPPYHVAVPPYFHSRWLPKLVEMVWSNANQ